MQHRRLLQAYATWQVLRRLRRRAPLLIIAGKQDPLVGWENAQLLRDAASGPTELHVFEEGNHSCQNIPHKAMPLQFIFLSKHLHEGTV